MRGMDRKVLKTTKKKMTNFYLFYVLEKFEIMCQQPSQPEL